MTSIAVREIGELCPICIDYFIRTFSWDIDKTLTEENIENIWRNIGKHAGVSLRFTSSIDYNKHLELHSSKLDVKMWTYHDYTGNIFNISFFVSFIMCAKCNVHLRTIESAKRHFEIHDFFDEKFGHLSSYVNDYVRFENDSGKVCCELCRCYVSTFDEEISDDTDDDDTISDIDDEFDININDDDTDVDMDAAADDDSDIDIDTEIDSEVDLHKNIMCDITGHTPVEFINHLVAYHLPKDTENLEMVNCYRDNGIVKTDKKYICPHCYMPCFCDSSNPNWKSEHSCFANIIEMREQLVEKPYRAISSFIVLHWVSRSFQKKDPNNYLQQFDQNIVHTIVQYM